MGSKVWVSFSSITFHPLREKIAKFYCTASIFNKIFHLVHGEVQDEVNLCTSKSCKVQKILRCTTFSWTSPEFFQPCIVLELNIVMWFTKSLKRYRGQPPWSSANLRKYEKLTLLDPLKIHCQVFRINFFTFNIKWTKWS